MKKCVSYKAALSLCKGKLFSLLSPFGNMTRTSSLHDLSMLDYHVIIYWAAFCCPEPPTHTSQWCLCSGALEECMI